MAAPNLTALTGWTLERAPLLLTTTFQDLIGAMATDYEGPVDSIYVCNIHASVPGRVTCVHKNGSTEIELAFNQRIPVGQTVNILLGRSINLKEGDSLRIKAN